MKVKSKSQISKLIALLLVTPMVLFSGCATSSHTAKGAGVGAVAGGATGAIIGKQSGETGEGAVVGALAGTAIGALLGAAKDARISREQEQIAQERAYQQEIAKMREIQARESAVREEELAIAEGMRITERELIEAEHNAKLAEARLKELQEELSSAKSKSTSLEDAEKRKVEADDKIRELEEKLKELKGED